MRARIMVVTAALVASLLAVTAAPARTNQSPNAMAPATVVLDWNANAVTAVRAATVVDPAGTAPRSLYQTEGELYMSYVQAAVYDAVTKIGHRYAPYHHFSVGAGNASIEAAAIAAAYNTLVFYLGDPGGALAAKYQGSIAALPDDKATARGIAVGEAAAADIEALRANDGRYGPSPAFGAGPLQPGLWVWAPPPSLQVAQTPWMAVMQPFMIESTSQFRAPAPPALTSMQYANDLNETEASGSNLPANDPRRDTAFFWNANTINQLNNTLQGVASQHSMDIVDAARLLAAGNMVPTDAGMACFDSKYTYQLWRPITAIRNADIDGNPLTSADKSWTPLVTTPNHPEYPSQHGCFTSALMQVLANSLGTNDINVTIMGAQNGASTLTTSRTFATVGDVDSEIVDARVWIGFHFRNSVVAGENLGTAVANWELQRYFLPSDD
jgi:PAP2 superfamily